MKGVVKCPRGVAGDGGDGRCGAGKGKGGGGGGKERSGVRTLGYFIRASSLYGRIMALLSFF